MFQDYLSYLACCLTNYLAHDKVEVGVFSHKDLSLRLSNHKILASCLDNIHRQCFKTVYRDDTRDFFSFMIGRANGFI